MGYHHNMTFYFEVLQVVERSRQIASLLVCIHASNQIMSGQFIRILTPKSVLTIIENIVHSVIFTYLLGVSSPTFAKY